jgi:DNA repair exonuclease SbcCD nuclease subunit
MRLLHFADLHLDAPFAWASPRTARLRRRNRRETLTRILSVAREEGVDAILVAGDLFEHERVSPDTVEFLRTSFERAELPVFLAPGNHDWLSERSPYATVRWSGNVHVFTEPALRPVTLADGLTLWGAAHRAPANTDGFFAGFRVERGGVHLALAHASERSLLGWQESGKQPHAPFDAAEVVASGLHHAFLGHYHRPRDAERHTYPGNPDPLEFGEEGERGAVVADVGADGSVTRTRHGVAVSQVHDLTISLSGIAHADDLRQAVLAAVDGLSGCVRVTLEGEVPPSVDIDLRDVGHAVPQVDELVIVIGQLARGYDLEAVAAEPTIRGQFVRDTAGIEDPDMRRRVVLTGLRALEGRTDLEVA